MYRVGDSVKIRGIDYSLPTPKSSSEKGDRQKHRENFL
jgi:hypothetical protein